MKLNCQNKKNYFARIFGYGKSVLFLLFFTSGILFLSHPAPIKEVWASNGKNKTYCLRIEPAGISAGLSQLASSDETCEVKGIFYDEGNPRVLVNEDLLSLNGYCCGGKITGIFAGFIVLEFPYGKREYKLGEVFRREEASVKPIISPATPEAPSPYVTKANSLVENFMASHSQHNAALNMPTKQSLFADPNEAGQIRVRASRMLELIQEKKHEFARLSVPDNYKRHHSLIIKLFDIAEVGWKAVLAGNKDKAEVFFGRLSKISQEISRESVSVLSRQ